MSKYQYIFISFLISFWTMSFASLAATISKEPTGLFQTSTGVSRHQKTFPVEFCADKATPSFVVKIFKEAMDSWNDQVNLYMHGQLFRRIEIFKYNCNNSITKKNENTLYWNFEDFKKTGDSLAIARTLTQFDEVTGEILDTDIILNTKKYTFKNLNVDLKSVLMHELGHTIGLQHVPISSQSIMHQYPYQSGIIRNRLSNYELETILKYYFPNLKTPLAKNLDVYLDYFSKNYESAISNIRNKKSRDAESYYIEGQLLNFQNRDKMQKKYPERIAAFQNSLKMDPDHLFARYQLAILLSEDGKDKEAQREYLYIIGKNPNFYEALAEVGAYYANTKPLTSESKAKAIFYLTKTLQVNPVHYVACFLLFQINKESKHLECFNENVPDEL